MKLAAQHSEISALQVRHLVGSMGPDELTATLRQQILRLTNLLSKETHQAEVGLVYDVLFTEKNQTAANLALNRLVQSINFAFEQAHKAVAVQLVGAKKSGRSRLLFFQGEANISGPNAKLLGGLVKTEQNFQSVKAELPAPKVVLLLTVNDIETQAVLQQFAGPSMRIQQYNGHGYIDLGEHGAYQVMTVSTSMGSVAQGASLIGTLEAIDDIQSRHASGLAAVIAVGVAFGIPKEKDNDRKLGDVLVSTAIQDHDHQRVNKADGDIASRGERALASADWLAKIRNAVSLRTHLQADNQASKDHWKVHTGIVLSGDKLIDNKAYRKALQQRFPEAMGGEMEGRGIATAAATRKIDWIVVKGICDWADGDKNAATKDQDQALAARNAATLVRMALNPEGIAAILQEAAASHSNALEHPTISSARTLDFARREDAMQENRGYPSHWTRDQQVQAQGEAKRVDALEHLQLWLQRAEAAKVFVLLGEYGMGKTVTCQRLYQSLLKSPKATDRQVFYFDLRELTGLKAGVPTLEGILAECIARKWDQPMEAELVRQAAQSERGALYIFDGLDEVLVHYSEADGLVFTKELLKILPTPSSKETKHNTRVLISCRSHLFRDLRTERTHFAGQDREAHNVEQFECMTLVPFDQAQIRDFLVKTLEVSGAEVNAFMALLDQVHDLKEVAQRPYTLSLISEILPRILTLQKKQKVLGVTVYREVVKRWLERDAGKLAIEIEDKLELAAHLAAKLWTSGQRSLPAKALENEMFIWLDAEPARKRRYQNSPQQQLAEELRNSSFLVRVDSLDGDQPKSSFRFAHTSMQEFFLAEYLFVAAREDRFSDWAMPLVSEETLRFFGQLLSESNQTQVMSNINAWRTQYVSLASEQRLKYGLFALDNDLPVVVLHGSDLRSANLSSWRFTSDKARLLALDEVNFNQADLHQAEFSNVSLKAASFSNSNLSHSVFEKCELEQADFKGSNLTGALMRHCTENSASAIGVRFFKIEDKRSNIEESLKIRLPQNSRIKSLFAHGSPVSSCAFNAAGTRIVSASGDKTVKLWDAQSYALLHTFEGHGSFVTSCAFNAAGTRIVSASGDKRVNLWDAESYALLHTFEGHGREVTSCAFNAAGTKIVSASGDKTVKLWDAQSYALLHTFEGHGSFVTSCAFNAAGTRIVSASRDKTVKLWDAQGYVLLNTFEGHDDRVSNCAFNAAATRIVSASSKTVKLWDAQSCALLHTFEGHDDWVTSCAFNAAGTRIVSTCWNGTGKLWDAQSYALLHSFNKHETWVNSCAFNAAGTRIVSASEDKTVKLWDAQSHALLHIFEDHGSDVTSCAFNAAGTRIVSAGGDQTVKLWDAQSNALLHTFEGHENWVNNCAFNAAGTRIVSASDDKTIKLWDAESYALLHTFEGHGREVTSCAFNDAGTRIVSASWDQTIRLWDAQSYVLLHTFEGHESWVTGCTFNAAGTRIVSASEDQTVKLWDAQSYALLHTFEGHDDWVTSCAFNAAGTRIVSASKTVKLWDAQSYALLHTFEGHSSTVTSCAFNTEGTRIVSASDDGTLRVWDTEHYVELARAYAWQRKANAGPLKGHIVVKPSSDQPDRVIEWRGDAWKYFVWEAERCALPPEWLAPGDEKYEIIPLEMMGDVPELLE
jgi:WD40 repeat protein/nucleoside phosphorylase/type II secretory pathway predicted ATPase ExeA